MRTKHLVCVLIHIRKRIVFFFAFFADRSKAVLLLLILFTIYVLCLSLLSWRVFSLQLRDQLLGKG